MSGDYTEFLVDPTGKAPKNLDDSIRRLGNASVAFVRSWSSGEVNDARATSAEAFEHLDFVLGELLRQRDVRRQQGSALVASPLVAALGAMVGNIVANLTPSDELWFRSLAQGSGSLPTGAPSSALTLETALVKLKHRDTVAVNFSIAPPYDHSLYALTTAGMGRPATLVQVDIPSLCQACRAAASAV